MRCATPAYRIVRGLAVLLVWWTTGACLGQAAGIWKPVSTEELALADNPAMPGDSAILLDRDSFVDDEKSFWTEYYRIKVFNESGRRFADIEIPYVGKSQEVVDIRARTIRADGTPAEFQGEIFDRVIVKSKRFSYQAKTFTLPDVRVGSIIEYSYRKTWRQNAPDVLKHPSAYLIPWVITIPTMRWAIQHELYTRHARFSVRPVAKASLQWVLIRGPAGASVQRQSDGTAVLEVRDVPPLEKEEMMPPADFLNSRVHFFYPVGVEVFDSSSLHFFWQGMGRRQAGDIDKFIGDSKQIAREVGRIVSASDPDETKLRKIYERVQQIRYLSYEPKKTEKELKRGDLKENKNAEDVLRRGYAFANEINYLFVAMARAAGFQAYIVKVADRSRQILDSAVPDASQFNAEVVNVHLPTQERFFDPATRFCPFELIPWGESGVKGLRLMAVGGNFVSVPGYHSATAVTRRTVLAKINREGALESTFHVAFSGQEALVRRLASYDDDDVGRRKALEDEIKAWLPDDARVEITSSTGWDSSQGDLQVDGKVSIPDFGTVAGRRLLFPPSLFRQSKQNPFTSEKRTTPIYFPYSYSTYDNVTLQFAEGLRVASLPTARTEYMNGDPAFLTFIKLGPRGIEYQRSFAMDGFIFDKAQYPPLKRFYEQVLAADAEQIVLQQGEVDK